MTTLNRTTNTFDNIAITELESYLNTLDTEHPDAHVALATILLSWTNANQLSDGVLASVLNEISFDQTLEPILEESMFFMEMLADGEDPEMYPTIEDILDAYADMDGEPIFDGVGAEIELPDLSFDFGSRHSMSPELTSAMSNAVQQSLTNATLQNIVAIHDANEDGVSVSPTIQILTTPDVNADPIAAVGKSDSPVIQVLTVADETPTVEQASESSLATNFIEDCAFAKGIAVISAEDWRKSKNNRNTPVIVKNFDFRAINRPDLGKASFLLVAPKVGQDVRIELRSQVVSGSAGDKLPVLVHKLHSLQQSREYGQTVVGVVGDTGFFSKYSLDLARQVAASSGLVIYAEGDSPVSNALNTVMDNVLSKYQAITPVSPGDNLKATDTPNM